MARRPRDADDDVSLFPFLSILACVIGTLTLMISGLALTQMDNDTVAHAEQYSKAVADTESLQLEIDQLKSKIDTEEQSVGSQVAQQAKELSDAKESLDKMLAQVSAKREEANKKESPIVIPDVDIAAHEETLKDLQEQLSASKKQIAQLEADIKERNLPPKESEVTVLPSGSGVGFEPVFVECAAGSIVLHTSKTPERIRTADMAKNKNFVALLKDVAASPKKSMVFLVRNDALSTYSAVSRLASANEVRNGKLPVIGKGRIDLSYFLDPENRNPGGAGL